MQMWLTSWWRKITPLFRRIRLAAVSWCYPLVCAKQKWRTWMASGLHRLQILAKMEPKWYQIRHWQRGSWWSRWWVLFSIFIASLLTLFCGKCDDLFCNSFSARNFAVQLVFQFSDCFVIFMPPAWKVRRGHLVFGLSVRLSVRPSVCPSVIPSRL